MSAIHILVTSCRPKAARRFSYTISVICYVHIIFQSVISLMSILSVLMSLFSMHSVCQLSLFLRLCLSFCVFYPISLLYHYCLGLSFSFLSLRLSLFPYSLLSLFYCLFLSVLSRHFFHLFPSLQVNRPVVRMNSLTIFAMRACIGGFRCSPPRRSFAVILASGFSGRFASLRIITSR